jgi:hypothetical protein
MRINITDVKTFIKDATVDNRNRTVILDDRQSNTVGVCRFSYHYDSPQSVGVCQALFTETITAVTQSAQVFFTTLELPMLTAIGPYHITLVTRYPDGSLVLSNALQDPVDNHIGLER